MITKTQKLGVLIVGILIVFLILGYANAGDTSTITLTTEKSITVDTNDYLKTDFNSQYGTITIEDKTTIGKLAEYSLIKNTKKCIDCEAYGKAVLYQDGKLFDDIEFKDLKNGLTTGIEYSQFQIKEISNKEVQIPIYKKTCLTESELDKDCKFTIDGYEKKIITEEIWTPYNYEDLKAGNYEWRLLGKISKSVDWIATSNSQKLTTWAAWTTADCYGKGGNVTLNGNYCVHTFTAGDFASGGSFYTDRTTNLTILLVAGGGGGGGHGGGGGAGGYNYTNVITNTGNFSVNIGKGGAGAGTDSAKADNGTSSNITGMSSGNIIVIGGGCGGSDSNKLGCNGGSGGGGAWNGNNHGHGTAGQGYDGGDGSVSGSPWASGGGGGAHAVGMAAVSQGGNGGAGKNNSITGTSICYAPGGGGNANAGTTRGDGGCYDGWGDAGITGEVKSGKNGTGGGGGGSAYYIDSSIGGAGGTGIVIITYDLGSPVSCPFVGWVKDDNNNFLAGKNVWIINQLKNTTYNTNTNATGGWNYTITIAGNYTVTATDQLNNTRDADASPFIECV